MVTVDYKATEVFLLAAAACTENFTKKRQKNWVFRHFKSSYELLRICGHHTQALYIGKWNGFR